MKVIRKCAGHDNFWLTGRDHISRQKRSIIWVMWDYSGVYVGMRTHIHIYILFCIRTFFFTHQCVCIQKWIREHTIRIVNHAVIDHLIVIGHGHISSYDNSVFSHNFLILPPDGSLMFLSFSFTLSSITVYSEKLRWLLSCNDGCWCDNSCEFLKDVSYLKV